MLPPSPSPAPDVGFVVVRLGSELRTVVGIFDPLIVGRAGETEMLVSLYRKLHESGRTVVELLFIVERVEGASGQVIIYFTPTEDHGVPERFELQEDMLESRRRHVLRNNYSIVSGRETGCIILVRSREIDAGVAPSGASTMPNC